MEEEFIRNQEVFKPSEEKDKEEREKMEDIRGSPLSVGSLEEMIDDNHAIVSSNGKEAVLFHRAVAVSRPCDPPPPLTLNPGFSYESRFFFLVFFSWPGVLRDGHVLRGSGQARARVHRPHAQQVQLNRRHPRRRHRPYGLRHEGDSARPLKTLSSSQTPLKPLKLHWARWLG